MSLERTTCSRCGGTGRYSWNQRDGDRCWGCNGKGTRLTKRGQVAYDYLTASMEIGLADLQIGDRVRLSDFSPFVTVTAIEDDGDKFTVAGVTTSGETHAYQSPWVLQGADGDVAAAPRFRRFLTADEKRDLIAAAERYQDTLNAKGEPR